MEVEVQPSISLKCANLQFDALNSNLVRHQRIMAMFTDRVQCQYYIIDGELAEKSPIQETAEMR